MQKSFTTEVVTAEADFVVKIRNTIFAIECKASYSPSLSKGNYQAYLDIEPKHTLVVSPLDKGWSMKVGIDVVSLNEMKDKIDSMK